MTFKEFSSSIFRLPARIFNGLFTLILGGYALKEDQADQTSNKKTPYLGLLGLLLEGVKMVLDLGKWIGRTLTSFLKDHEKAIASAFWMSLLVSGAAALTVAFWPAALAFVANFAIAGYSIASIVGAGFAAQVAATAAVTAAVTSASVYTVATVANFVNFVKNCFTKPSSANEAEFVKSEDINQSAASLGKLSAGPKRQTGNGMVVDAMPVHMSGPLANRTIAVDEADENTPIAMPGC